MRCPRCGFQQADSTECKQCGKSLTSAAPRRRKADGADAVTSPSSRRLSAKRALDLCQSLGNLLTAGHPLEEAMDLLAQSAQPAVAEVLTHVRSQVTAGTPLWKAFTPVLPAPVIPVVRLYEELGDLPTGFRAVVAVLERRTTVRSTVFRGALVPLLIIVMVILLAPLTTLVLDSTRAYLNEILPWVLGLVVGIGGVVFGLPFVMRSTALGLHLRRWAWKLPWPLTLYVLGIRMVFWRITGVNVQARMSFPKAIQVASLALPDPTPANALNARGNEGDVVRTLVAVGLMEDEDSMLVSSGLHGDATALKEALDNLASRTKERFEARLRGFLRVVSTGVVIAGLVWTGFQMVEGYTQAIDSLGTIPELRDIQDLGVDVDGGVGREDLLQQPEIQDLFKELNRSGR